MAFSPEQRNNSDPVERKRSLGEQLQFQFGEDIKREARSWEELLGKKTRIPNWAKFIGAGVGAGLLIGAAWYLKRGQKVADWSESLGWKLAKLVKDGLRELRKK